MPTVKLCSICKKSPEESKTTKYYDKRRNKMYFNSKCIKCTIDANNKRYKNNKEYRARTVQKSTEYRYTENGLKSQMVHDSKKRKNDISEITLETINKLQVNQNNKCALTGIELVWYPKHPHQASVDRIDSTKGYTEANVQLLILPINRMKTNYSMDKFNNILQTIRTANSDTQVVNVHNLYTQNRDFKRKVHKMFSKIISRDFEVQITIDDILLEQNMKCLLTGVNMTYEKYNWNVISVDRIDNTKG